jgi:hypothetical protein
MVVAWRALAVCLALCLAVSVVRAADARPNVLFILADDLGWAIRAATAIAVPHAGA